MRVLIIDRRTWLRGKGPEKSALLCSDGTKCCLGFESLACGLPDALIEGKATVTDVLVEMMDNEHSYGTYDAPAPKAFPEALNWLVKDRATSAAAALLMDLNDTRVGETISLYTAWVKDQALVHKLFPMAACYDRPMMESEEQREQMIAKVFAMNDIEVRFEN